MSIVHLAPWSGLINLPQIYRVYAIWAKRFVVIIIPTLCLIGSLGACPCGEAWLVHRLTVDASVTGIPMCFVPAQLPITSTWYQACVLSLMLFARASRDDKPLPQMAGSLFDVSRWELRRLYTERMCSQNERARCWCVDASQFFHDSLTHTCSSHLLPDVVAQS
jgi:hypothetical protein